jgi:hypothetical protein
LFVLSFAASAFAIHAEIPAETQAVVATGGTQITLGGELRFRGWYYNHLGGELAAAVGGIPDDTGNSKANYDGRVRLSIDAKVTPNVQGFVQIETGATGSGTTDTYTWGDAFPYPKGGYKPSTLNILQAWIQYTGSGLFGFPAGIKVGHMPLALGERQFFDHTQFGDDAIVFFMDPTKQVHIGLLTVKFLEGASGDNRDDIDGYVALTTFKINDKNTIGANFTALNQTNTRFRLKDLGIHANGNIAGFGYKAEADMQFGDANDARDRYRGYGVMLGANYKINPVNIRAGFALGSGDDDADDDKIKNFQTFVGTIQHYTFVYDYRAVTTAGFVGSGISNTTYYNVGLDFEPMKNLALSVDGYLLRATKTNDDVSKKAGYEIDGKLTYKIAKNLTYQINAGYFRSSDFYEDTYGVEKAGATVVNNILTLSF